MGPWPSDLGPPWPLAACIAQRHIPQISPLSFKGQFVICFIWVCLKIVYPYTQWLMIIPTKWLWLGVYPIFKHTHMRFSRGHETWYLTTDQILSQANSQHRKSAEDGKLTECVPPKHGAKAMAMTILGRVHSPILWRVYTSEIAYYVTHIWYIEIYNLYIHI